MGWGLWRSLQKVKIEIAIKIIFALMLIHAFSYDLDWIEIVRARPISVIRGFMSKLNYEFLLLLDIDNIHGLFGCICGRPVE